jgi:hypothetical protein
VCPVCDHDVPRGALACPECGADHNSGWREDAENNDGLDLPDEQFDYEQFVQREFRETRFRPDGIKTIWWITAIVIIVVSVVMFIVANWR